MYFGRNLVKEGQKKKRLQDTNYKESLKVMEAFGYLEDWNDLSVVSAGLFLQWQYGSAVCLPLSLSLHTDTLSHQLK